MPLAAGDRLGPYEILALIGAGGMGEVWKARDGRLDRTVALKFSADQFSERFDREARAVAALNHPHICTLYDVGPNYLVMEYIDGPTLAEWIAPGPIPLEKSLPIARQIAQALEAAHEKGIVHRDLKPANIKLTRDGNVKVLDFGLAKAVETENSGATDPSNLPTLTLSGTRTGVILGTAGYMSPEQARGYAVDKRADIWAYGVVLFEMLSGRQTFAGETVSDTLAAVLRADLEWSALPADTPEPVRKLLRRCLQRDRTKRLRDIGDVLLELDDPTPAVPAIQAGRKRQWLPWAIAAAAILGLSVAGFGWWRVSRPVPHRLIRLSAEMGPGAYLQGVAAPHAILSPDGSRVVYTTLSADGKGRLATRALDQRQPEQLAGTEGAEHAFFSPDGKWVGFIADGKLKKVLVQGGGPVTLCDAPIARGASWGDDGTIIAALNVTGGLSRVPAAGGAPQPVGQLDQSRNERSQRYPQVLPGSKAVLFVGSNSGGNYEDAWLDVLSLQTGQRKTLHRGAYFGRYLPSGHLLYMHQGTLFAAAMDPGRLELTGQPVPVLEDVASYPSRGSAEFDFSQTGTFAYVTGGSSRLGSPIMWLDRSGKTEPLLKTPGNYVGPRFSPDGKRLALASTEGGKYDVWIYDIQRDTKTRLTFLPGEHLFPVWTPNGKRIAFTGPGGIYWMRADGAGEAQRLTSTAYRQIPYAFSTDGKWLVFVEEHPGTAADIWTLPIDAGYPENSRPGKPEPFLHTNSVERDPQFSPDGRWLAYTSNESGTLEVYVRPFPGPGGKWQISSGGGSSPAWSQGRLGAKRELLYVGSDNRLMAVTYTAGTEAFAPEKPRVWSEQRLAAWTSNGGFDLAPDGQRVAALQPQGATGDESAPTHVVFLLNFFDELRRRTSAR